MVYLCEMELSEQFQGQMFNNKKHKWRIERMFI